MYIYISECKERRRDHRSRRRHLGAGDVDGGESRARADALSRTRDAVVVVVVVGPECREDYYEGRRGERIETNVRVGRRVVYSGGGVDGGGGRVGRAIRKR